VSRAHLGDALPSMYRLYVELVAKNPLYTLGEPIDAPRFAARIEALMEAMPCFA
jgi:Sybindin-like family